MSNRYSAWGMTYPGACRLIDNLKAAGIEANISAGGIAIYPSGEQVEAMKSICKEFGTTPEPGLTPHQENVVYRKNDN